VSDPSSKVYIRVLKDGPAGAEVWHVRPGHETYLLAKEHAEAVQIAFRVAKLLEIDDVREETQEQVDSQRKKERARMAHAENGNGNGNGNGRTGLLLRWGAALGIGVGSYSDIKLDMAAHEKDLAAWRATVDYRLDHEYVRNDDMRSWVEEVRLYNQRRNIPELPVSKENR
jgi:hypothetical protein